MDRPPARLTEVDDTAIGRPDERRTGPATVHQATYVAIVVLSAVGLVALLVLVRAVVG
jgi:hypothetical protein